MASNSQRRPRAQKPKSPPADQPTGAVEIPEDAQTPINGVIVIKIPQEDGGVTTDVQALGSVQITEIETLLGLGLKGWRERVGLTGG